MKDKHNQFRHESLQDTRAIVKYLNALATSHRLSRDEGIDKVMQAERLDAIAAPTGGLSALIDPLGASRGGGGGCTTPTAMAGYPILSVPMGFISELPLGVSLYGRAWSEPTLLKLAYAFEQVTKARRKPEVRATAV